MESVKHFFAGSGKLLQVTGLLSVMLLLPQAVSAQKQVHIPAEWDSRGIPWSMDRSYQSDNFIIFWGEKAGDYPMTAPQTISFDPAQTAEYLEDIFTFYVDEVNFIPPDHGNFALYKFIIVINETWNPLADGSEIFTGWAFGGSYDSLIGAMWIHPKALNRFTLAHEFTHSMQNMAWIDYPGHGFINNDYVGSFWETHANFMALQANPQQVENTDPARFLSTQHFYWSSARHHYTNWMFLQYIHDTEGMELINRLWRESNIGEHPLQTLKRLKGIDQYGLNDLFGMYTMRNVTFDYSNGAEVRYSLANEIDNRYITRRFTTLEPISVPKGRYIVPRHLAPQDYGYNIVRLYPDEDNETGIFSITFRIHDNAIAGGGGTRTGFVFVTNDGTARYSDLYRNDFTAEITPEAGETAIYMVVTGAPNQHHNYAWEPGFPKIYRFPWEIRIVGAKPAGYNSDPNASYKPGSGRIHPNGGGFVAYTASVSLTAYVGPQAVVKGTAIVSGNARIEDAAVILDQTIVGESAVISGHAVVSGNAVVKGDAVVTDYARVSHGANISGNARIEGSGSVFHSTVRDHAVVKDNASMWGATLTGTIVVGGDAEHFGACSSGKYLQIFDLGGRGCDGNTSHPLNYDINPAVVPFSDEEMGMATSTGKISDIEEQFIFKQDRGSGYVKVESADGRAVIVDISVVDITGRLIIRHSSGSPVNSIDVILPGKGLYIVVIETPAGPIHRRIVN